MGLNSRFSAIRVFLPALIPIEADIFFESTQRCAQILADPLTIEGMYLFSICLFNGSVDSSDVLFLINVILSFVGDPVPVFSGDAPFDVQNNK